MTPRPIPKRSYLGTPATAPGPAGPEMLTQFSAIRRDPLQFLVRTWRQFGDVVQFPIPRPPAYLVNDPEGVRRVLVMNGRNYGKSTIQYRSLSLVTGEGLLTADTPSWTRQRPLVQPAFHHETLTHVSDHVATAMSRVGEQWLAMPDGAVIDVDAAMMKAALEVVGHALFGTDLSGDADVLTRATLSALDVVIARARPSIVPPAWMPTPLNRQLATATRTLDAAVQRILSGRNPDEPATDMVGMLMSARDAEGHGLSHTELRDQIVTFIVAGHETVASALTWTWALLAAHPDVQERVQAESDAVLAGRPATFDDLPRLPLARAVIDEALRLYPPAWLITRNALDADELGGYAVPAGALVILSPWLLHRHPDVWDDAEAFDPDRFLDGRASRTGFVPFGAGLRQCIGKDFAYAESTLVLATLAGRFRLSYPAGGSIPPAVPLVTVRPPAGLPLRVTRR